MRKIKRIIIHCTDSPDDLDIGLAEINQWHKARGWESKKTKTPCGYHHIIRKDGKIQQGRLEEEVGSHCFGYNRSSIGITVVGRNQFNPKQAATLNKLCRQLIDKYGLKPFDVYGHYELDDRKTCPNMDMHKFRLDVFFTRSDK